ncbi:DUF1850 domain-containing protein [Roseovarius aquimarinus]|uniref:DUF1850 domain-containing protein n=1 Tax=Roseovarius aquimarinus TaxID=1229156 RepID=A0ABW7I8G2_9RHOB
MSCLMVGAASLMLAAPTFELSWTHSVERVAWQEEWRIDEGMLTLTTARVRGSGAGMEPGEGATLRNGWWEWPGAVTVPTLTLAASGATGGGWTLCTGEGECREIGAEPGAPLRIAPCDSASPAAQGSGILQK